MKTDFPGGKNLARNALTRSKAQILPVAAGSHLELIIQTVCGDQRKRARYADSRKESNSSRMLVSSIMILTKCLHAVAVSWSWDTASAKRWIMARNWLISSLCPFAPRRPIFITSLTRWSILFPLYFSKFHNWSTSGQIFRHSPDIPATPPRKYRVPGNERE